MILFSKIAKYPIHPLTGYQAVKLTQAEENLLFATQFALCGLFISQMPCFTIDNVSVQIGHFNGAQVLMHSLCFDPREDMALLEQKIHNASPGEIIMLHISERQAGQRRPVKIYPERYALPRKASSCRASHGAAGLVWSH